MRLAVRRHLALATLAAVALVGCSTDEPSVDDPSSDGEEALDGGDAGDPDVGDLEDLLGDAPELEDPNDQVEGGVFRGAGVVLPVPDGWSLDQGAFAQGVVAALSSDGSQQLTAQAVDVRAAEEAGQALDLDSLLDAVREQVGRDADVDTAVEFDGAQRAHRLTFLDLPGAQDGAPSTTVTIVLAEDGAGLLGEFVAAATSEEYDESLEAAFLDAAGFDPGSEPRAPQPLPAPAPAPEGP